MKKRAGIFVALFLIASSMFPLPHPSQAQQDSHQTASFVPGRVLVRFRPEIRSRQARALVRETGADDAREIPGTGVHIVELPAGADEEAYLEAFNSRADVEFAELDRLFAPEEITPDDPSYTSQWHLPKIAGPAAWPVTTGSSSVKIAIIDTGVDPAHPDLAAKMVPGWNFYDNNSDTRDVYGHGTAVAGSAAAIGNNGLGVASVAWGCSIMPLRVSATNGMASTSAIASAITWAADHGARVANVSYMVAGSSTVSSAAQSFHSRGGVLTVSAGNYSTFDSSPDNPYMLVVSATDQNDALASWSNTGNNVDLSAPGVSISTTTNGGAYGAASGTSFSAPIAAGVAALVLSANAALTPSDVTSVLQQSADDLGSAGRDASYGWGRVNAERAVALAGGSPSPDTVPPSVSITSPTAGGAVSGTISVEVAASDDTRVASVNLSLDGVLLGGDADSPYSFSWNTLSASNGLHRLTTTATDAAGNTSSHSIEVTVDNFSDITPPSITITSPVEGSRVSGVVPVYVNASDDAQVSRVELYVDGVLKANSVTSPFTLKWNTKRARSGAHTLQCKAYDSAGNVGISPPVTVYK